MYTLNILLLTFVAFVAFARARLGGWSSVDTNAAEVVAAVTAALHKRFPDADLSQLAPKDFKVIDVKKQVQ
jgi:hypothetical protein